jgi:hypothetical protein
MKYRVLNELGNQTTLDEAYVWVEATRNHEGLVFYNQNVGEAAKLSTLQLAVIGGVQIISEYAASLLLVLRKPKRS